MILLKKYEIIFIFLGFLTVSLSINSQLIAYESFYSIDEIIERMNLTLKHHKVQTEDGYTLTLFRLMNPQYESNKKIVLFMSGFFDSSDVWTIMKNRSPAINLLNAGYDVWLGNTRDNKYCHSHIKYFQNQSEFYNFNLDTIAQYDLPAIIEYIFQITKQNQLAYIGHGMGNTIMFNAMAENINYYQDKISIFMALSPMVNITNMRSSIFKWMFRDYQFFEEFFHTFNVSQVFPKPATFVISLITNLCNQYQSICDILNSLAYDEDSSANDDYYYQAFFGQQVTAGSSKYVLKHFSQIYNSTKFQKYDYGEEQNLIVYNQKKPPQIDVAKIKDINIAIFLGIGDLLSDQKDAHWLRLQLDEDIVHYDMYNFGYKGFYIGYEMKYLSKVKQLLRQYT